MSELEHLKRREVAAELFNFSSSVATSTLFALFNCSRSPDAFVTIFHPPVSGDLSLEETPKNDP